MKAIFRFCLVFFGCGARGSFQLDDAVTHGLALGTLLPLAQHRNISEVDDAQHLRWTPVTFTKHGQWHSVIAVLEGTAMKKLLILGALSVFLAAHGVVTAMTIYPQLDALTCDGSHC
jgi:hypothetical protein